MTQVTEAYEWRGRDVVDADGDKIGTLEEVYLDTESGRPEWATVKTGLFGRKQSFVPLSGSQPEQGQVVVGYTKDQIKDAPSIDPDGELSHDEEERLYRHYGLGDAYRTETSGSATDRDREPVGQDVSGPETDNAMTRSEEELRVGTTERERGRARLRKYVVTEEVQQTVPVQREEVRVEREPITEGNVDAATSGPDISDEEHEVTLHEEEVEVGTTQRESGRARLRKYVVEEDVTKTVPVRREEVRVEREPITEGNADAALDGPAISEEEHEVVLHEEEPVVQKQAVPKERVRLEKDTVTDEEQISETARKEQIDIDQGR